MRRRLFTFCSAVSLLLCAALCVLWGRSYWSAVALKWTATSVDWMLHSNHGRLTFCRVLHEPAGVPAGGSWHASSEAAYAPLEDGFAGFSHRHLTYDVGIFADIERRDVSVPHAFVAVLLAIAPATRLRAAASRRRRERVGCCPSCNYDLRATPDRCPECGRSG